MVGFRPDGFGAPESLGGCGLEDGDALSEVSRFVWVEASLEGGVVGEELEGYDVGYGGEGVGELCGDAYEVVGELLDFGVLMVC